MSEPGELGRFLRTRREGLAPEEAGLPSTGRRRTPGLRREELATLANVSIDYLVRLEQGRDTNPSAAVLASLSEALRLSEDEKRHLVLLALKTNNAELCHQSGTIDNRVRPSLRWLVDGLDPTPAFVLSPINDLLAWNDAWGKLAGSLGLLEGDPPNTARFTFLNPAARRVFTNWAADADRQAARLSTAVDRWGTDPKLVTLLEDLSASPDFSRRRENGSVTPTDAGGLHLVHPAAGSLRITVEVLLDETTEQRILSWLPADEVTENAIRELIATPLHIVRHA
jgi:transcriptional regulator with XRE-family HTH domain